MAKVVRANQQDWDVYLHKVLIAYLIAVHESTQFTPYHVVFGWSPVLFVDVMLQNPYHSQPREEVGRVDVLQFEDIHHYIKEAYTAVQ